MCFSIHCVWGCVLIHSKLREGSVDEKTFKRSQLGGVVLRPEEHFRQREEQREGSGVEMSALP